MKYYRITYDAKGRSGTYRAVWGAFNAIDKAEIAMKKLPRPNSKVELVQSKIKVALEPTMAIPDMDRTGALKNLWLEAVEG